MKAPRNITILAPYPLETTASQRFRFEHYLGEMEERGFRVYFFSFWRAEDLALLRKEGKKVRKSLAVLRNLSRSLLGIPRMLRGECVFLHREFWPLGFPFITWLLIRVFGKPLIFDLDDALWQIDPNTEGSRLREKRRRNVPRIMQWSYLVSCGNKYIQEYASKYCHRTVIVPTVVDTEYHRPKKPSMSVPRKENLTIGWTGSYTTNTYIEQMGGLLGEIERDFPVNFLFISNAVPNLSLRSMRYLEWSATNEIRDLSKLDIGIMPLSDDEWSKGKCGFKLIQYMAMKIPVVASAVGINEEIIEHGKNGFLAENRDDWYQYLKILILQQEMARNFGEEGRKKIIAGYSRNSARETFFSLFEEV